MPDIKKRTTCHKMYATTNRRNSTRNLRARRIVCVCVGGRIIKKQKKQGAHTHTRGLRRVDIKQRKKGNVIRTRAGEGAERGGPQQHPEEAHPACQPRGREYTAGRLRRRTCTAKRAVPVPSLSTKHKHTHSHTYKDTYMGNVWDLRQTHTGDTNDEQPGNTDRKHDHHRSLRI